MQKVLIMTVGTGATGADIAHGLFFSIKDSNPNKLLLIGSTKSFETTLPHLKGLIKENDLEIEIEERIIEEINDFENLHFEYLSIINDLIKNGIDKSNISVDYTSGTKAMSAALVSAAITSKISSVLYVYGQRGDGGRVKSGTERRSSLSPNKIFSQEYLNEAIEYFNSFRFTSCINILNQYEFHPDFEKKVQLLKKLAEVFDTWDKFNFSYAFELSKKISLDDLKLFDLKGKFEGDYQPLLIKLKSEDYSFEKVVDLCENAKRRATEGRFDDAVARLYRALEMLGQIEFKEQFQCPTSNVIIENIPETFREEIKLRYFDKKDGKIKLPSFATFELLGKVNNTLGLAFNEKIDDIKRILSLRNNSILAHGSVPLKENDYTEALNILKQFINSFNKQINPISFPTIK